jgi:Flp pilus assembly protein TadB
MEILVQVIDRARELSLDVLLIALLAGVAVIAVMYGFITPPRGKPIQGKGLNQAAEKVMFRGAQKELVGLQSALDQANLNISVTEFIRRGLTLGIPLGIGLFILIGAVVLFFVGVFAGFSFVWTQLEQERDRKQVKYSKLLASACDTIRTAYGVNPSLKKALEAAAEFSQSPLKEDFQEILIALGQERFVEGLQVVADRRRSIVFDGVSTALIRASEATGEVSEMLHRLAVSTRQNVACFEEALSTQINARSNITWSTYGPWMIFTGFKVITFLMVLATGQAGFFGSANNFFNTVQGNIVALLAAGITMAVNRYANTTAQRGLVVKRLALSANQPGQLPVQRGQSGIDASPRSVMGAQSRPAGLN